MLVDDIEMLGVISPFDREMASRFTRGDRVALGGILTSR